MTWGELGSTPLRLDGPPGAELDMFVGALSTGPFQVQSLGKREAVGHALAHKRSGAGSVGGGACARA
eukprot:256268-Chlamydomonas_euryale.AAC.1